MQRLKDFFRNIGLTKIFLILLLFLFLSLYILVSSPWYTLEKEWMWSLDSALETFLHSIVVVSLIFTALNVVGTRFVLQEERMRASGATWRLSLRWVRKNKRYFLFSFENLGIRRLSSVKFTIYGDGVDDNICIVKIEEPVKDSKHILSSSIVKASRIMYENDGINSSFKVPISIASTLVMTIVEWESEDISYHRLYKFDIRRSKLWLISERQFVAQAVA